MIKQETWLKYEVPMITKTFLKQVHICYSPTLEDVEGFRPVGFIDRSMVNSTSSYPKFYLGGKNGKIYMLPFTSSIAMKLGQEYPQIFVK